LSFNDKPVQELAEEFSLELVGNENQVCLGVASLDDAQEGDLSFIRSSKYMKHIESTQASVVIVPKGVEIPSNDKAYLLAEDPYISFAQVLTKYFSPKSPFKGVMKGAHLEPSVKLKDVSKVTVEPGAFVDDDSIIGEGVRICAGSRIGRNVTIGDDVQILANVVLEDNTIIGNRVILNPGVVIGGDGFGYTQTEEGSVKLPQIGNAVIEDDVEIGANSTVDRGSLGPTIIGKGTKIDNLVQIGHGAQIGKHNVICSQSGIAGSVQTGDHVILASRAGIGDHLKVGDKTTIGPMAGVTKDLPPGGLFSGFPAMPHQDWLKMATVLSQLPALREQFKTFFKK
jgi:UDP-3-O-[3-hydroxymyristoyl] glucosamine N-acyltransferase